MMETMMIATVDDTRNHAEALAGVSSDSVLVSHDVNATSLPTARHRQLANLGIDPLGLQSGNAVVFHRAAGEILVIKNSKESLSKIGWDRLLALRSKVQRDGSVAPDLDQAFEVIRSACEVLGQYSPRAVRGPGLWLNSNGKLVVNDGTRCWRDGEVTYVPDGMAFLKPATSPSPAIWWHSFVVNLRVHGALELP